MAVRAKPRGHVLDANALFGFFEGRKGVAEKTRTLLEQSFSNNVLLLISAVTWGEVFYLEWRYRGEAKAYETESKVRQLPIAIVSVDQERATRAGALKQKHGLSYADSFAAELAIERKAWLVTADQEFEKVSGALFLLLLPRYEK
jgi:predicted nucleic acid-binding protein